MADIPVFDKTIIARISEGLSWLDRQIEKIVNPTAPPPLAPVDMTDEQLHSAIYNIGAVLLNDLGKVIQDSFARHGYDMNNRRFRHPITITVPGHVLTMSTDANDAYGLVITALNRHAHAAALGPIRFILESLAWLRWLLEDPDDKVRAARAYRLTMNAVENFRSVGKTVNRVTSGAAEAKELDSRLTAASDKMKSELLALADEDGVIIPPSPGSVSKLSEQYLSGHGGYLTYAVLNVAGAHAGPVHGYMFYGYPETGFADYDFKHMFDRRAHWTAVAIRLYLDVCDLTAPVLDWPNWDATAASTRRQLQPLADEAERRYEAPMRRALARIT